MCSKPETELLSPHVFVILLFPLCMPLMLVRDSVVLLGQVLHPLCQC